MHCIYHEIHMCVWAHMCCAFMFCKSALISHISSTIVLHRWASRIQYMHTCTHICLSTMAWDMMTPFRCVTSQLTCNFAFMINMSCAADSHLELNKQGRRLEYTNAFQAVHGDSMRIGHTGRPYFLWDRKRWSNCQQFGKNRCAFRGAYRLDSWDTRTSLDLAVVLDFPRLFMGVSTILFLTGSLRIYIFLRVSVSARGKELYLFYGSQIRLTIQETVFHYALECEFLTPLLDGASLSYSSSCWLYRIPYHMMYMMHVSSIVLVMCLRCWTCTLPTLGASQACRHRIHSAMNTNFRSYPFCLARGDIMATLRAMKTATIPPDTNDYVTRQIWDMVVLQDAW